MSAKAEAREQAYTVWRECGQNLSETERKLNREGLPVSRQTLTEWAKKYDWQGRAARAEAAEANAAEVSCGGAFLGALLEQKDRYEAYFRSLPIGKIDNQALYAYSAILKTLVDLSNRKQPAAEPVENARTIETEQDAVEALWEAVERRLNCLLAKPETVTLGAIKEMKQALELVKKMREEIVRDASAGSKAIDQETLRKVREELCL